MARRAAAVDASFFAANPLFLKPCSRPTYSSFIHEHFPSLVKDYEARYGKADFATQAYSRELAKMVARACRRHGLQQRSTDALLTRDFGDNQTQMADPQRIPPASVAAHAQQQLFA